MEGRSGVMRPRPLLAPNGFRRSFWQECDATLTRRASEGPRPNPRLRVGLVSFANVHTERLENRLLLGGSCEGHCLGPRPPTVPTDWLSRRVAMRQPRDELSPTRGEHAGSIPRL